MHHMYSKNALRGPKKNYQILPKGEMQTFLSTYCICNLEGDRSDRLANFIPITFPFP